MGLTPLPSFTDGLSAISSPVVECMNIAGTGTTYQRYTYLSDTIDREPVNKEQVDGDGTPLGSDTKGGFEKGALSLQLFLVTDHVPQPGHLIRVDDGSGFRYYVCQKPGRSRTNQEVIKIAPAVLGLVNPFLANLLSEAYGQMISVTQAAGALTGTYLTAVPLNTRAGGTLAYALAAAPGFTLPGWLSVSPTTGLLSGTSVAGTFEFDVVVTETLTGGVTRAGKGRVHLVVT